MPARYSPLPNSHPEPERADRELDAAFDLDDDDEEHTESTPLTHESRIAERPGRPDVAIPNPGTYDFERDYDYPPPGSPPGPSAVARPNDYGNSNGLVPQSPVQPPSKRPSFFRRTIGALLPQHYAPVPTEAEATSTRPRGGGIENDGVFANVMAKPGRAIEVRDENGEVFMVPEDTQKDMPPTYHEAQADAAPSYWETTVHAPVPLDLDTDMIVDDLPTGSMITFVSTAFVSYFFSFVGFLLTYLLHTTHAAKYGSRAGLGITLIQYGFFSRNDENASDGTDSTVTTGSEQIMFWNTTSGTSVVIDKDAIPAALTAANGTLIEWGEMTQYKISTRDWLSLLFMTLGWFLLLSSIVGYYRVKRWETSIRAAAASSEPVPREGRPREAEARSVRSAIDTVFRYPGADRGWSSVRPGAFTSEVDARVAADLRSMGII